jgi:hypothetical protein
MAGAAENAVPPHVDIFPNSFVKNTDTTILFALTLVAIILSTCVSLQVKPTSSENNVNCYRSRLRRQSVETNCKNDPACWIARLQGVDYCPFIGS